MDFDKLLTPDPTQSEGVWIYHPESDTEYKLASVRQRAYQDFAAQRYAAARRGRRELPQGAADRILVEGVQRFILKDWRPKGARSPFRTKDGELVPCNKENAKKLLEAQSNEAALIRDFIIEEASNDFNFTTEPEDEGGEEREESERTSAADDLKSRATMDTEMGQGTRVPAEASGSGTPNAST